MHSYVQRKQNYVFDRIGYKCVNCGTTNNIEVHHIRYTKYSEQIKGKRGVGLLKRWGIYAKEVDLKPCPITSVCSDCHKKIHRGEL